MFFNALLFRYLYVTCIQANSIMARQTGILKFKGSLGGLSFYRHKHYGMLVRQSNPVSAERMRTDPAFARTRENSSEFGRTSKAAKLLRHGLLGFLNDIGTEFLDNRLMKHMLAIKDQDFSNARGQRCVSQALADNPALLGGFELQATQTLGRFMQQLPVVDTAAGKITWTAYSADHLPPKATHIALTAFCGSLDFAKGTCDIRISESRTIALSNLNQEINLKPPRPTGTSGIEIWGVKALLMQEINGELYPLQLGAAQLLQSNEVRNVVVNSTAEQIPAGQVWLKKGKQPVEAIKRQRSSRRLIRESG
jgi:hypothetical protein